MFAVLSFLSAVLSFLSVALTFLRGITTLRFSMSRAVTVIPLQPLPHTPISGEDDAMSPILAAWLLTGGTTVIGIVMALLLMRSVRSPALPRGLDRDTLLKFAEGERDRLQAVAKGLATTSSVFLVALVTALVDDSISKRSSPTGLVCLLLGAVGMLFIAVDLKSNVWNRLRLDARIAGHRSKPTGRN